MYSADDYLSFTWNDSVEAVRILADGNVVPCCLAYDSSISMGKINQLNLQEVLEDGKKFLNNLRTKNLEKHETCKKCFGEPTKRGAFARNVWNSLPNKLKRTFNSLKLTKTKY